MVHELVKIVQCGDNTLYSAKEKVGEYIGLAFDSQTKVVYHMFKKCHSYLDPSWCSGYMAPYISENGKYCRFIDNQIVEID